MENKFCLTSLFSWIIRKERSIILLLLLILSVKGTSITEGSCHQLVRMYDCTKIAESVLLVHEGMTLPDESKKIARCLCETLHCPFQCKTLFSIGNEHLVEESLDIDLEQEIKNEKIGKFKKKIVKLSLKVVLCAMFIFLLKHACLLLLEIFLSR